MKYLVSLLFAYLISGAAVASDEYGEYLTLLGFKLEESNLIDIRNELGNTAIQHSGDAGDAYYGLCYVLPKDNITIIFESGEMGGKNHSLLSFVVKNATEKSKKCGILANTGSKEVKVGILELGKNIESIKSLLPQPVTDTPFGFEHKNFGQKPFSEEDIKMTQVEDMKSAFWDVFTSIEVYVHNGVINGYKVSRVTSW